MPSSLQSPGNTSSLARVMAWVQSPPVASSTVELGAPLHVPVCALSEEPGLPSCPVQAGHAAASAPQLPPPIPLAAGRGACFQMGPHRWRGHPTRPDGCMAGNPAVQAHSCPSEQAAQLLILPRNRHSSPCGHHTHKGPCVCVGGSIFSCRKTFGSWPPLDSFARCSLAPSGWWTPGVSSRLDEWLFDWLVSRLLSLVLCE